MNNTILAIDLGSFIINAVIAKHDLENNINILGTGSIESSGVNKGLIINIEEASKAIKEAVNIAKRSTPEAIDSCAISISGTYCKSIRSSGSVNVPNGLITETEINQVMKTALFNATIVPEYEIVHVVPIFFKVDDSIEVSNPLDMNGSILEVSTYIVTAKRTALTNIKSALKFLNIDNIKFVLDGYASAIAILDEQQKKFGSTVINLGATTTEVICYKGSSLIYNSFVPVGSNHITNDLSVMLHTPPNAAEKLKVEYGSLTKDYSPNNELGITKVKIPRIGDEDRTSEIALEHIQTIIHARVEEILIIVRNKLIKSGTFDSIGSGIAITGGLSNLDGIKELAEKIFDGIPITLSNPKNIKNGYMSFDDPSLATIIGLLYYSLGTNRTYQLNSNKKLIKPIKKQSRQEDNRKEIDNKKINNSSIKREEIEVRSDSTVLTPLNKDKKKSASGIWSKLSEWF